MVLFKAIYRNFTKLCPLWENSDGFDMANLPPAITERRPQHPNCALILRPLPFYDFERLSDGNLIRSLPCLDVLQAWNCALIRQFGTSLRHRIVRGNQNSARFVLYERTPVVLALPYV